MGHLFCMDEEIRNARTVHNFYSNNYNQSISPYVPYKSPINETSLMIHPNEQCHLLTKKSTDSYQHSMPFNSDYPINDSHLSNDFYSRYVPEGKPNSYLSPYPKSNSRFSIISNPHNPLAWTNDLPAPSQNLNESLKGSLSSHQQIASAFASFYLQNPQHFQALQQHLNTSDIDAGSCFESTGQPDNLSMLSSTKLGHLDSESMISHCPLAKTDSFCSKSHKNSNYLGRQIETNHQNRMHLVGPIKFDRFQPMGSSQPQLILQMANSVMTTNGGAVGGIKGEVIGNTLASQSDSGLASGSGKISIDLDSKNLLPTENLVENKLF